LLSKHELPTNDTLGLIERGKIHLRMHAGKLSHGILEPLVISINDVIVEFLFGLLEELDLLSQLPFHLPQLDFVLGGLSSSLAIWVCIPSTFSSRSTTLLRRCKIFASNWRASWDFSKRSLLTSFLV